MSEFLVASPVGSATQQPDFQLDPNFDELQVESFELPSMSEIDKTTLPLMSSDEFSGEPFAAPNDKATDKPAEADEVMTEFGAVSAVGNQTNTNGEPVQDASDATEILLALEKQQATDPTPDSFLSSYWPYLLVGVALVGWVILQLGKKRAPSFKHHKIQERPEGQTDPNLSGQFKVSQRFQIPKSETETPVSEVKASLDEESKTGPKLTGQFKISQRFQKPKSEVKTPVEVKTSVSESTSASNGSPGRQQEVDMRDADRPSDDEFEITVGGDCSDSDVIDEREVAEIIARVDAGHSVGGPSARFKSEVNQKNGSPKDRVDALPKDRV